MMPVVRDGIGVRPLRCTVVSGVFTLPAVVAMFHPRHCPRRRDPVEDQRQNEREME